MEETKSVVDNRDVTKKIVAFRQEENAISVIKMRLSNVIWCLVILAVIVSVDGKCVTFWNQNR